MDARRIRVQKSQQLWGVSGRLSGQGSPGGDLLLFGRLARRRGELSKIAAVPLVALVFVAVTHILPGGRGVGGFDATPAPSLSTTPSTSTTTTSVRNSVFDTVRGVSAVTAAVG